MQDMVGKGSEAKPVYEFEDISQQLIKVLLKSAEDQVAQAQELLTSVKALTEDIEEQIKEHAFMLDKMNGNLKAFGAEVLNAHKKYLNGK
jgi:hypothetical protein